MVRVLRDTIGPRRDQYVLATGAYNWIVWHEPLRRTLERRLRQMRTDYIDIFNYFGVTRRKYFTPRVREELQAVRESGLVRAVGISTHDRKFAAELAREGVVDAVMVRYNAASRGAEAEIFGHWGDREPAVVGFTATRWRSLLRRPARAAPGSRIPTAGQCYRFVLSNAAVNVCLMAPGNLREFDENLEEIRRGRLDSEEMAFMREFGDRVR
jgi:aryl-alcohol dehydrogenase-like predicted oxidoreductase